MNWGDVPAWLALSMVAGDWIWRGVSWYKHRKGKREARKLSESDIEMLREANRYKGLIAINVDKWAANQLWIKEEVAGDVIYGNDSRKEVQAGYVAQAEKMIELKLLDLVDDQPWNGGRTRTFRLTDKAYQILKGAPKSGNVIVPEPGEG